MNVDYNMSISTPVQGLFSLNFLEETLTEEVHRLLSLRYGRRVLEALEDHPEGFDIRWFDVNVVGTEGSARTAFTLVKRLAAAGWVAPRPGPRPKRWVLTKKGREALQLARQGDRIEPIGPRVPSTADQSRSAIRQDSDKGSLLGNESTG